MRKGWRFARAFRALSTATAVMVTVPAAVAVASQVGGGHDAAVHAAASSSCSGAGVSDGFGITCVSVSDSSVSQTGGTQRDIAMTSTAIFQASGGTPTINPVSEQITVRVYLPPNYDPNRATPYQTLYLLNGGGDNYDSWTSSSKGNLYQLLQNNPGMYDGIVVMPTGGMTGWYSDWPGHTDGFFAPKWDTYHVSQLVPWIDANFHTVADRSGRAIAGLSMGGFGALKYAGEHPDVFSAVGAFSPGSDLRSNLAQGIISDSMWQSGASINLFDAANGNYRVNLKDSGGNIVQDDYRQKQYRLDAIFGGHTVAYDVAGNPIFDWPQANPADFVAQGKYASYSGKFGLYAGGCVSMANPPSTCDYDTANEDEPGIGAYAARFDAALTAQNVSHRYCYGTGSHNWNAWQLDLHDFLEYAFGTTPANCPVGV